MTFTFETLKPTKGQKKEARPSSKERRDIKQRRHLRCAITDQTYKWGERHNLHLHHKHEVQYGGTKDKRNLVLIERNTHHKLHLVARTRGKRLLEISSKYKSMERRKARRLAMAESCIDTTNHAIEMSRLAQVADLGYDLRYVYGNEYKENPEVQERVDRLIGQLEG